MSVKFKKWRQDEGGIDFIQLIVGLMIISIAAVGTLQALYYGYDQLDFQMRYRKAISIARSHVEYIQGRLHSDYSDKRFSDLQFTAGNLNNPDIKLLDQRDPSRDYDDIYCEVSHGPMVPVNLPDTKGDDYWPISVYVRWSEPGENDVVPIHMVHFAARMVPAGF
ncbi:MAG TPA: hypothetical protein ENL08_03255 [Bacteroidetes bacterium]|nr:hypothetical protein [Bacteroidota bacterium]